MGRKRRLILVADARMRVTTGNGIVLRSPPRCGAAAALSPASPATGHDDGVWRTGCATQRALPGGKLGTRIVYRRSLLGIEGFAVRIRFDPDRRTQRTAPAAVDRRECQLLLEVLDPLKSS